MGSNASAFAEGIHAALLAYENSEPDRYGFTELDVAIAAVRERREKANIVRVAVEKVLNAPSAQTHRLWEGIRSLILQTEAKSPALAKEIEIALDGPLKDLSAHERLEALRCCLLLGQSLSLPRLDREDVLKREAPAEWSDLALAGLRGAPDAVIKFLARQVAGPKPTLTEVDVRRRIPLLFEMLGQQAFVACIQAVVRSLVNVSERVDLVDAVDDYYSLELRSWLAREALDKVASTSSGVERPNGLKEQCLIVLKKIEQLATRSKQAAFA